MIITETVSSPVVSNISSAPSRFKIKASAKAFKILSGFYSEPILAIPRELGANAWDSHVKAGNTSQMFEVHAPNTLEPWFSVRDFGTGLSPEAIDTIYTTYFESTKTADNDSDGCMGLGSKTPFNYTENFNVTSWYNGKKYVYNCFIDESGAPNIMQVAVEDSSEHNGVEVKFGVKISDIPMWTDKIRRAYEPFRYRPIIKGASITYPERKYVFSGKNWGLRESSQNNLSNAFMGNYCYPISSNVVYSAKDEDRHKMQTMLYYSSMDFYFDIGDLDVAPNKEQLQYDDTNNKTAKAIIRAMSEAIPELEALVKKSIETPQTLWEAMGLFTKYNSYDSKYSQIRRIIGDIPIYFGGKRVDYSHRSTQEIKSILSSANGSSVGNNAIEIYAFNDANGKRKIKRAGGVSSLNSSDVVFYYTSEASIKKSRIRHHLDNICKIKSGRTATPVAYVIVDQSDKFSNTLFLKTHFGWNNVVHVESLPKPPPTPRQKKVVVSNEAFVADISSYVSWAKNSERNYGTSVNFYRKSATVDANSTYYYIDFMYTSPVWNGKDMEEVLDFVVKEFVRHGLNGSSDRIYGINRKNSDLMKVGKWINVFDLVKTNVFDANKEKHEDDYYKANQHSEFSSLVGLYSTFTSAPGLVSKIKSESTRNMFLTFIKTFNEISKMNNQTNRVFLNTFGISPKCHKPLNCDINAFRKTLETKYMNIFSLSRIYTDDSAILANLINFIDEKS